MERFRSWKNDLDAAYSKFHDKVSKRSSKADQISDPHTTASEVEARRRNRINVFEYVKSSCLKIEDAFAGRSTTILSSHEIACDLCTAIEFSFRHGLKNQLKIRQGSLSSIQLKFSNSLLDCELAEMPHFFGLLQTFASNADLAEVNESSIIDTPIGRCRWWVRSVLNTPYALSSYVDLMAADTTTLRHFYEDDALMLDPNMREELQHLFYGLGIFDFSLNLHDDSLNSWLDSAPLVGSHVSSENGEDEKENEHEHNNDYNFRGRASTLNQSLLHNGVDSTIVSGISEEDTEPRDRAMTSTLRSRSDGWPLPCDSDICTVALSPVVVQGNKSKKKKKSYPDINMEGGKYHKVRSGRIIKLSDDVCSEEVTKKGPDDGTSVHNSGTPSTQTVAEMVNSFSNLPSSRSSIDPSASVSINDLIDDVEENEIHEDILKPTSDETAIMKDSMTDSVIEFEPAIDSTSSASITFKSKRKRGKMNSETKNTPESAYGHILSSYISTKSTSTPIDTLDERINDPVVLSTTPNDAEVIMKNSVPSNVPFGIKIQSATFGTVVSSDDDYDNDDNVSCDKGSFERNEPTLVESTIDSTVSSEQRKNATSLENYSVEDAYSDRCKRPYGNVASLSPSSTPSLDIDVSDKDPATSSTTFGGMMSSFFGFLPDIAVRASEEAVSATRRVSSALASNIRHISHVNPYSGENNCHIGNSIMSEWIEADDEDGGISINYDDKKMLGMLGGIFNICPERGLDTQSYKCAECSRPCGMPIMGEARLCDYDGRFYCTDCHSNSDSIIPARILHNWDFSKYKVSKTSLEFLSFIFEQPIFNVGEINPWLYSYVEELKETRSLRQRLEKTKEYITTCKSDDTWSTVQRKMWPREYLVDDTNIYSLHDILNVQSGLLSVFLEGILKICIDHIRGCDLCKQRGYFCEYCSDHTIIYPFETSVAECDRCHSLSHISCFYAASCPKCLRIAKRRSDSQSVSRAESDEEKFTNED